MMESLEELSSFLNRELSAIHYTQSPSSLYDPINYTIALGGKRIRPLLVLLGNQLFQGNKHEACCAAIAIELFHNFTLIHDDIMDQAPLRRGKETVYKKWNINTAILSGDAMIIEALKNLCLIPTNNLKNVLDVFNKAAIEVCEGQQMDMDFEEQPSVSIADYLSMIERKTAVLLGASLQIGAIIANASIENQIKLYQFGVNLGIAFQLQDDLLDVFADDSSFGKVIGGDIVANKKTFLWLTALENVDVPTKEEMIQLCRVGATNIDANTKVNRIKEIYINNNIHQITTNKIDELFSYALSQLNTIQVETVQKQNLLLLANALIKRKS